MDYLGNKKSTEVSKSRGKFADSKMTGAIFFKKLHRKQQNWGTIFM